VVTISGSLLKSLRVILVTTNKRIPGLKLQNWVIRDPWVWRSSYRREVGCLPEMSAPLLGFVARSKNKL
jgi:hypothetical protein